MLTGGSTSCWYVRTGESSSCNTVTAFPTVPRPLDPHRQGNTTARIHSSTLRPAPPRPGARWRAGRPAPRARSHHRETPREEPWAPRTAHCGCPTHRPRVAWRAPRGSPLRRNSLFRTFALAERNRCYLPWSGFSNSGGAG
jgi:hypothetical protein